MTPAAQLHQVTPAQLDEFRRLYLILTATLGKPAGSTVDPEAALAALRSLVPAADQQPADPDLTDYTHHDFLYLTLPPEVLARPIEQLKLPVFAYNACKRGGINTLGELLEYSETDLRELHNFGDKAWDEVTAALARQPEIGLHASRHDQGLVAPPGDDWVRIQYPAVRTLLRSRLLLLSVTSLVKANDSSASSTIFALRDLGVRLIGDLLELTEAQVLALDWAHSGTPTFSRHIEPQTAIRIIKAALSSYGLQLRDDPS